MGNHEFCTECGESDFHQGEPCDPAKKAAWEKRQGKSAPKPNWSNSDRADIDLIAELQMQLQTAEDRIVYLHSIAHAAGRALAGVEDYHRLMGDVMIAERFGRDTPQMHADLKIASETYSEALAEYKELKKDEHDKQKSVPQVSG